MMQSHLIGETWHEGAGPQFESIDPATRAVIWRGRQAGAGEVDSAVSAARAALKDWSARPMDSRIEIINRFAALLGREKQAAADPSAWHPDAADPAAAKPINLAHLISLETGKPRWEAIGEVDSMINKAPISIRAVQERRSPVLIQSAGNVTATRYKPHGVVAVFGPFNFPGHLPNGHIIPALLAGNVVIFKPSELTPWVSQRTVELWQEAGLPAGVINLLQGGRDTGQLLAQHPGLDGIFFTGSVAGGIALSRAVADRPNVILALEMGGNNPLIVWDVAPERLDVAAILTIQSAYLTAGQRCSCARRLIVEDGPRGQALIDRLMQLIPRIRYGRFSNQPEPFMGPLIRPSAASKALEAQDHLLSLGARPLLPMRSLHPSNILHPATASGLLSPGLIDVTAIADPSDEEIFAPLLQVIRVSSFTAAIAAANATRYGLVAALLSDDAALYVKFAAEARAGIVNFNKPTTGASSSLPFGGIGLSGNHRPSAYFAADYCSYPVASMESAAIAMPANLPPGLPQFPPAK